MKYQIIEKKDIYINMKTITEEQVKDALNNILLNESSKVKREDFNRVVFKIEELQNSLNETIKDLKKLESSIPPKLKTITKGRIGSISSHLGETQELTAKLKEKVNTHKRNCFARNIEEKKK